MPKTHRVSLNKFELRMISVALYAAYSDSSFPKDDLAEVEVFITASRKIENARDALANQME